MMDENKPERIQINLDLSPELYETINKLKQQINGDTAEILLKGIILLEVALEAKLQGKQVWITDDKQNLESEIVGI
ncbi:DNA-binding protein [Anabaena azotica FACHB-119]|uniref:DNA-binding protein n=2 Tax=Anabaena azotica TaxID=197653 RepID=A0ABR8DDM9_9NOST|nr:DNA-binding protein [Anabaena azotica FACHB-119]